MGLGLFSLVVFNIVCLDISCFDYYMTWKILFLVPTISCSICLLHLDRQLLPLTWEIFFYDIVEHIFCNSDLRLFSFFCVSKVWSFYSVLKFMQVLSMGVLVGWLVFVNLTRTRAIWEEGTLIKGLPPSAGKSEGHFLDS